MRRQPYLAAKALTFAFGLLALAAVARAQVPNEQQLPAPVAGQPPRGWDVTLGVGVALAPRFPGAKHDRVWPAPLINVRYDDLFFVGPLGAGVNVLDHNGLRAGPLLGLESGRYQSWDSHLSGLGDIQPSLGAGGFVSYTLRPFTIIGTVRQAVTHSSNGLTGRLALAYRTAIIPRKLDLVMGPELDFDNSEYARTWFGVSPSQSVQSGLPGYAPKGGLKDAGVNAGLTYHYTEHILVQTFADVSELTGQDANSPIVQRKTQTRIGVGLAYHF